MRKETDLYCPKCGTKGMTVSDDWWDSTFKCEKCGEVLEMKRP